MNDDLVAGFDQRQEERGDGRHAGGCHDGSLRAFEVGDPALEQVLRRIVLAPVKEAMRLVGDHRIGCGDVGKGEGRGHVDWRRHGAAILERVVTRVDRPRLESEDAIGKT